MQRNILIGSGLTLIAAAVLFSELINVIMTFLLAGIVPGTHIIAPYWLMMAIYCVLISLIATPYLERIIKVFYDKRRSVKKKTVQSHRRSIATTN
jgi:hypothetical protein